MSTNSTLFPMVEVQNSIAAPLPPASRYRKIGLPRHRSPSTVPSHGAPRAPLFRFNPPRITVPHGFGAQPKKPTMSQHAAPD